jgi:hypothetical protein
LTDYVLTANEIDADPTVFRRKPSDVSAPMRYPRSLRRLASPPLTRPWTILGKSAAAAGLFALQEQLARGSKDPEIVATIKRIEAAEARERALAGIVTALPVAAE